MFSKKRSFILLIALLMIGLIATGCNNGEEAEPEKEPEVTPEETEQTEPETPEVQGQDFVVYGDTINSHLIPDAVCVVNSRFEQGQRLVFRASVNDVNTKELIRDAKVKVVLGNGEEHEMVLGEHGEEKTELYTHGFTIPDDFQTGTLDFKYVAEVDGEEYEYEPFDVSLSKLTVVEMSEETKALLEAAEEEEEEEEEA